MGSDMSSRTFRGSARDTSAIHRSRRGTRRHTAAGDADVRLTLPARPENVAVVRHVLGAFGEALRLPHELVEDIRLAATEACTNVVRHAYRDGETGPIDIMIRPDGDRLELVVSDRGQGLGPSADATGPGLGLPLIAALSDSVELQALPLRGSRIAMSFRCSPRLGVA
jgi:serine/threonine-protein kinase RsbW